MSNRQTFDSRISHRGMHTGRMAYGPAWCATIRVVLVVLMYIDSITTDQTSMCEPSGARCDKAEHGLCIMRASWEKMLRNVRWAIDDVVVSDACNYHPDLPWNHCAVNSSRTPSWQLATQYHAPPIKWRALPDPRATQWHKCGFWRRGTTSVDNLPNDFSQARLPLLTPTLTLIHRDPKPDLNVNVFGAPPSQPPHLPRETCLRV